MPGCIGFSLRGQHQSGVFFNNPAFDGADHRNTASAADASRSAAG
jgi:hypothetical protein